MRRALPLLLLLAAACAGDPEAEDYPRLLPLETLLADPALPPHAAADPDAVARELRGAQTGLEAEAEAARAGGITDPALIARAEALRQRAEALKGQ